MAQVFVTLGLVLVAVICLSAVTVVAWAIWRRSVVNETAIPHTTTAEAYATGTRAARTALPDEGVAVNEPQLFDRVVRVMTLIFLASVGVAVFAGGEYPDSEAAIQLLLAAGMLSVVLFQDLLPAQALGRARYWLEALVAVVFIALLTGLTGGLMSPFVIGFFLVVAGASLSMDDVAPLMLALLAAGAYAAVGVAVAAPDDLTFAALSRLVFIVISLALLAYLASVVGREQRRAREAALSLSRYDPLTGMYNRAHFFSVLDREIRLAARNGGHFAVLMIDLDDLKPVNDTFGHQRGDELLRAVTGAIERNVRGTDVAARYGGDEFVILLSDTEPEGAHVVAEKLRTDIAALVVGPSERPARTSASIGVVVYPEDGTTMEALMADADKAMYESKRRGKNQIVGYVTRTERVATPFGDERVTMMERPAPRGDQGRGRMPAVAPMPRPYPAATRVPTDAQNQARSAAGPESPAGPATAPPPAAAAGRPTWDSTTPPGGASAGRARPPEPQPYVAFPVEGGDPVNRPPAPDREQRGFTER